MKRDVNRGTRFASGLTGIPTVNRAMSHVGFGVTLLALAGCAVSVAPQSASFRGGDPKLLRAALGRAGESATGPVNATGRATAYVVFARPGRDNAELLAFDLESSMARWQLPIDLDGRIAVARPVVVHGTKAGGMVAHDVTSGAVKWQKSPEGGWARLGYAAGGDVVAEVVQPDKGGGKTGALNVYDAATGSRRFRRDLAGPVGAPAVWRGLVAVPRQSQWVSLYDARTGDLLAEILSRKQAANFVRGLPEGLFFGSGGVFLATPETALADKAGPAYLEAKLPEFVRPVYHPDHYRRADSDYSAVDRNRLLWRATTDAQSAKFLDGTVVVHNYRFFFALDPADGKLKWAYNQLRTDAISSEHTGASVVFVTTDGEVKAVDAKTGRPRYHASLPGAGSIVVAGATFDADGFAPRQDSEPAKPLPQVLSSMIFDPDRRFADVRMFALEQLTTLSGPEVTRELLRALDGGEVIPTPVLRRAMDVLVARQDKDLLPVYMEALRVQPDYAEGVSTKRLEFYARAVASLKARQAIPLLVEYLRLPDTDFEAIEEIAAAVLALEARTSIEPFADFLLQYRADPAFTAQPAPLVAAANVLAKLGSSKERALLQFVAEEPQTLPPLAEHLRRTLAQPEESVIKQTEE